jgi:hypothetical protein
MGYLPPLSWLGVWKLLRDAKYTLCLSRATPSMICYRFPSEIDI